MHFLCDPGFEMAKASGSSGPPFASVNDIVITNGPISLIRVAPGSVGLATSSKQPVLQTDQASELVLLACRRLLVTPPISGRLSASALVLSLQVLLGAGLHYINDPSFEWKVHQTLTEHAALGSAPLSRCPSALLFGGLSR